MSRRGAGSSSAEGKAGFDFYERPDAVGDNVVQSTRALLRQVDPDEAASLLIQASACVAQMDGASFSREEWLALCAEHWDSIAIEADGNVTAPGGSA